ncbi:MAG TPA: DUF6077 domain-containing protein [Gemmatimonadaceae bacterium]|nr:DUF6077 domain-containing protein [Gemmatimonadaceae bacterium]
MLNVALALIPAVGLFVLPGYLFLVLAFDDQDPLERIALGLGVSFAALTLINVPLFLFHLNVWWLVYFWVAWTVCLIGWLLVRMRRGQTTFRLDWRGKGLASGAFQLVVCIVLLWIAWAALVSGTIVTGEEEIELIITRKLLENHSLSFTNVNYLDGFPTTYLITPFYLFRAFLSALTGLDPITAHYRLAFLPAIFVPLVFYALIRSLTQSRRAARFFLVILLVHLGFSSSGRGEFYSNLPFVNDVVFRVPLSFTVMAPLSFIFLLMSFERQRPGLCIAIAVLLFVTTLVTQAVTGVAFLIALAILGTALALEAIGPGDARTLARQRLRRVISALALCLACAATFFVLFGAIHQSTQGVESAAREAIVTSLRAEVAKDPWLLLWGTPSPVYFRHNVILRVTTFRLFDGQIASFLGEPITLFTLIAAPLFVLVRGSHLPLFFWLMWAVPMAVLRIPLLFMPILLTTNLLVLKNLHALAAPFQYIGAFLMVVMLAGLLNRIGTRVIPWSAARYAVFVVVALAAAWSAYQLVATHEAEIRNFTRTNQDVVFVSWFGVSAVLAAYRWWGPGRIEWPQALLESRPALVLATAVFLPLVAMDFSGHPLDDNLYKRLQAREAKTNRARTDHELLYENASVDRSGVVSAEMLQALQFIRTLPPHHVFHSAPETIRAIPFVTNAYIAHSGVPFDFEEAYFIKYVEEQGDLAHRRLVYREPLFGNVEHSDDELLNHVPGFLTEFGVDYVLTTPPYEKHVRRVAALMRRQNAGAWPILFDRAGYVIYDVRGVPR